MNQLLPQIFRESLNWHFHLHLSRPTSFFPFGSHPVRDFCRIHGSLNKLETEEEGQLRKVQIFVVVKLRCCGSLCTRLRILSRLSDGLVCVFSSPLIIVLIVINPLLYG
jgi:hypothetical protein